MASGDAGAAPETPAPAPAVAVEQKPKKEGPGKGQKKPKGKGKGKSPWKQWDGPSDGGGFRLNVKNLGQGISTGEQLKALFAPYGNVTDAKVKKKEDGTPQNFGFVIFASESEARAAQNAMSGRECNGKPLKVAPAERRADLDDAGKGKGGPLGGAADVPPMDPMAMMMFQQMQMQQAMMSLMNPGLTMPGTIPGAPGGLPGAMPGFPGAMPGMPLPGMNPFLGAGLPGMPGMPGLPGMDGTYEGTVKSTSEKSGYGFIQCADTYAIHKRDVYVDKERLPAGIRVGERVRFTMEMNEKSQPKATFVQRA